MSNLRAGRDEMFLSLSRGRDFIPGVNLVLQVPKAFGAVEMEPSPKTDSANPGRLMNAEEISSYDDLPGLYAIGWKGANVRSNAVFAVNLVKRQSKP
jgi:hypothetical protein